jgi:glycosyltransferase involved in cell wall biosynthesis
MAHVNVLMFGWELPPHNSGGLGVACYGLTKGLASQGINISFALPRQLPVDVPFMNVLDHSLQGVSVTAINAMITPYITASSYHAHIQSLGLAPFYSPSLYDEAHHFATLAAAWTPSQNHELIHVHDWMTFPAGMKAKSISGNPLITHVHATEFDRTGGSVDSRIADLEYRGLTAADKVIAVSHYTKNMINKHYSIPKDKIAVVHNGIDPVDFSPQDIRRIFPHDKIVLYVGRLTFQKGVDHYLRSAKEVLKSNPDTVFLVVGDGDMYHQLIMEAAYLEIADRVIFTGFMSGEKLRSIYQMADVFVMPSISEPYGLVALEAIASGVPTIISKQSGVSETMNHVHKVDFWDIHKMASLIRHVLDYPAQSKEMVKLAQKELFHNSWEKAAQKTISIYQTLV